MIEVATVILYISSYFSLYGPCSWIRTLEAGVQGARQLLHRREVAKVASVTPEKIRLFDEKVCCDEFFSIYNVVLTPHHH